MSKNLTIKDNIKFLKDFLKNSAVGLTSTKELSKKLYIIDKKEEQSVKETITLLEDFI
ncbi:hypothetical protein K9M47_03160 [Candidatus Gracilibacteria bacterium]|nr:hypothetical protein [Candidatus Gracilibacteria bacterium]